MLEPHTESESVEFEVKPALPRVRSRQIAQAAVGLGALVIISLAAALIVRGPAASPIDTTARVMPANTFVYFSMTTRPDQQPHYDVIENAWKDSKEARMLSSALQVALMSGGYSWEDDIQPWLGDRIAVGVIDLGGYDKPAEGSTDAPHYNPPFFVLAVQTRDKVKSDAFLASFLEQQRDRMKGNGKYTEETYRSIPVVYAENFSQYAPYGEAYATLDDVLVLTLGPDNLKKVIDAALDGTGLAANENFKTTMSALPAPNVGAFYMDMGKYIEATMMMSSQTSQIFDNIVSAIGEDTETLKKQREERERQQQEQMDRLREMMAAFGGMGVAMTYEPGGIRFDMVEQYDPAKLPEAWRPLYDTDLIAPSSRIFESIPATAIAAYNGSAMAAGFSALLDNPDWLNMSFGYYPGVDGDVAGKIAEFEKLVGVDLTADLLDLFNGEMAFVILPKPGEAASADRYGVPFEFALMLDSSDAGRVETSVSKLLEALLQKAQSSYTRVQPLSGLPYTALAEEDGDVMFVYGVVDGRFVIGTNSNTLLSIDNADQNPLSNEAAFKSAVAALPANRTQTGYMQFGPLWDWIGRQSDGASDSVNGVFNYLRPFKWVSVASEMPDAGSGIVRAEMHIGLEAVPSPQPSGN